MIKVFFLHCPKAGGTSIRLALERMMSREQIAPLIENDAVDHVSVQAYDQFRGYNLYSGHYGRDAFEAISDGHIPITNFRHPVNRLVSLYNYFRDQVELPADLLQHERYFAVRFAKEHDFDSFIKCDDPKITVYSQNQHIRQLTRSPWELTEFSLSKALTFVFDMPCFYICEFPELSSMWLREALGLEIVGTDNATIKSPNSVTVQSLERETIKEILARNAGDFAVYQKAVDLFLSTQGEIDNPPSTIR